MRALDSCNKEHLEGTAAHANCVKEVEHEYFKRNEALKEESSGRKTIKNSKRMRKLNK